MNFFPLGYTYCSIQYSLLNKFTSITENWHFLLIISTQSLDCGIHLLNHNLHSWDMWIFLCKTITVQLMHWTQDHLNPENGKTTTHLPYDHMWPIFLFSNDVVGRDMGSCWWRPCRKEAERFGYRAWCIAFLSTSWIWNYNRSEVESVS